MTWDPGQYLTFGDHRLRPAIDPLKIPDVKVLHTFPIQAP
jgi:trans-aconitate methyltransferase